VGGVIYQDEVFANAVRGGLSQLGVQISDADFARVYDQVRQSQSGSIRSLLSEEFLGGAHRKKDLIEATDQFWAFEAEHLYKDAITALTQMREIGLKTAIVANQPARVMDSLADHGVLGLVDFAAISGVVGFEKPDARLFWAALDALGVEPTSTLHVGNRIDTDVRPAKALGMSTAWVLRGEAPPAPTLEQLSEPDIVIDNLDELLGKVETSGLLIR